MESDPVIAAMMISRATSSLNMKENEDGIFDLWRECTAKFGQVHPRYRWIYVMLSLSQSESDLKTMANDWSYLSFEFREEGTTCVCGQRIQNLNWLQNKTNSNVVCMDEHCLAKFGNAELVKVSALKTNKYHYDKSGENAFRQCVSCGRFVIDIDSPPIFKQCKGCYISKVPVDETAHVCLNCKQTYHGSSDMLCSQCDNRSNLRPCEQCGQYKIFVDEPEWKRNCSTCHQQQKLNVVYRECVGCHARVIPDTQPEFKKLCHKCYRKK